MQGKQWIFLAPCSNPAAQKHLSDTIVKGIKLTDIEQYLNEADKRVLQTIDILRIWGNVPAKAKEWEDMEVGDVVLFYQLGSFTHAGKVSYKTENEELSKILWPDFEDGKPWRYIYFLQETREVNIPLDLIRNFSGYDPGFIPMGFMSLREKGIDAIVQKYGVLENFLKAHEVVSNQDDTDSQCLNLLKNIKADDLIEKYTSASTITKWTNALKGFSARKKDESYDAWIANTISCL